MSQLITEKTKKQYVNQLIEMAIAGQPFTYRDVMKEIKCLSPRDVMMQARKQMNKQFDVYGGNINSRVIDPPNGRKFNEFYFEKDFVWEPKNNKHANNRDKTIRRLTAYASAYKSHWQKSASEARKFRLAFMASLVSLAIILAFAVFVILISQ